MATQATLPPIVFATASATAVLRFTDNDRPWSVDFERHVSHFATLLEAAPEIQCRLGLADVPAKGTRVNFTAGAIQGHLANNTFPQTAWFITFSPRHSPSSGVAAVSTGLPQAFVEVVEHLDDWFGFTLTSSAGEEFDLGATEWFLLRRAARAAGYNGALGSHISAVDARQIADILRACSRRGSGPSLRSVQPAELDECFNDGPVTIHQARWPVA